MLYQCISCIQLFVKHFLHILKSVVRLILKALHIYIDIYNIYYIEVYLFFRFPRRYTYRYIKLLFVMDLYL